MVADPGEVDPDQTYYKKDPTIDKKKLNPDPIG